MSVSAHRVTPRMGAAEIGAWRALLQAHAGLVKMLDSELEQTHGLALSSYEVLVRLDSAPQRRLRMCELAQSILLSRSGVTRLVDRLERDGLVAREECPHDARGAFAVLTDAGEERLRTARPTHIEGVRRHFLSHYAPAELEALRDLLGRLAGGEPTGC
jgi:DNA-binding MarR family transcriptional regulator